MRKKKQIDEGENLERWLLTYADLITLLLAFFIVLYSMSRIDAAKFNTMSEALNDALHGSDNVLTNEASLRQGGPLKIDDLKIIKRKIGSFIENKNLQTDIETVLNSRGLIIHLTESAFFEQGQADIKAEAKYILKTLSDILVEIPNDMRIEGHTDDVPIHTSQFPSNWELSTARATNVLRFFIEECKITPDRISALGFGEYRPRASNSTPNDRKRNRRTDIVILGAEAGQYEPTAFGK
ncbi:MAG: OmpA family protein [candidate division Zixibacteria bacterium]|nr:OmpA family protein [candidate division Zixibacteria bacterium]